jgi:uncharacterized integral membrane protein
MDLTNNQKIIQDFKEWLISNEDFGTEIQDSEVEIVVKEYINHRGKQFIENHFGNYYLLKSGNIYEILRNELANYGLTQKEKKIVNGQDVLERFIKVPLHLIFLYTSEDDIVHEYIIKNWDALDSISGDFCDIHPLVDQFKKFENGYDLIDKIEIVRKSGFKEISKLPGLFFWDNNHNTEFISFGKSANDETMKNTIRFIFEKIRINPTIHSIKAAKDELEISLQELKKDTIGFKKSSIEKEITIIVAIFIILFVVFLVIRNEKFAEPEFSTWTRILLSLAVSTLGATLPGYLKLKWSGKGLIIRAGGAIALFVLTYLFSPSLI